MTSKELNRDIKKLASELYRMSFEDLDTFFKYKEKEAKEEFTRLYYADREFKYMNLLSIKIMIRLNLSHRFIAFHNFGNQIDVTELLKH